jgi:hypothetical protein
MNREGKHCVRETQCKSSDREGRKVSSPMRVVPVSMLDNRDTAGGFDQSRRERRLTKTKNENRYARNPSIGCQGDLRSADEDGVKGNDPVSGSARGKRYVVDVSLVESGVGRAESHLAAGDFFGRTRVTERERSPKEAW